MRAFLKLVVLVAILGGVAAAARGPVTRYLEQRNRVEYETAEAVRGDVIHYVQSTGRVEPVLKVSVGSFVSGPIVELNVDFNDTVKKGDVMARIDPRLFRAAVDRDRASLASSRAELQRVDALLEQAAVNYRRGLKTKSREKGALSQQEIDDLKFQVRSLEAQRKLAEAGISQAEAALETSLANLEYCDITAPVDGVVINRLIDPGQTLAAQFQTPELFIVAPDLRQKVHVFASVDEADIGLVQTAQAEKRPVSFTVDAHPDEVFGGTIEQLRVSSTENQNVITYPVVIAAENPDLKLLPGMTANLSFEVDESRDVVKIPNAALRYFPEDQTKVRKEDRSLVDGSLWQDDDPSDEDANVDVSEMARRAARRNLRHVWVADDQTLRAIEIRTGLADNRYTEVLSGDVTSGLSLVTGIEDK